MRGRHRLVGLLLGVLGVFFILAAGVAFAALPPGGTFTDDNGNVHEGNIEAIAAEGITRGCNPPTNDLYCPSSSLTRGQMAAFIRRALSLPPSSTDYFNDDDDSVFEGDINAIAEAGITRGCNPPTSDRFCPSGNVTREQMAAFLRRAFEYPFATTDYFVDDDSSVFEADINAIARAGVTLGCNPPTNSRYCPTDLVKRDQMASFFSRALGFTPIVPPPPTTTPPPQPIYVTMRYQVDSDSWDGTAGSEMVLLDYATTPYGGGWLGSLGTDSVSLGRSDGAVWRGYIGTDPVVMYDNTAVGNFDVAPWTGSVGSESILLTGGYWQGPVNGFIGSMSVSLTCDEETASGRGGRGTGPRPIAALLPILCETWGYD